MEAFLDLLSQYGPWIYALLFFYCALKSGALPLFGGYAAYAGALDPVAVAVATFAGGYLGDEMRFALARRHGAGVMGRRAFTRKAMHRAQALMAHYGIWYIFLYRYPKGMRTIGALPVGLGEMPWRIFSPVNAASAALWTGLLVGGGYFFGGIIARAVETNWGIFSVGLLVIFVALAALGWWRVNRLARTGPGGADGLRET
ncbi:DedA family protein [Minwuia sp.]|uniref:DedA family protein n=1 Tax=Minwuia sp. TaxID=2493630 RepID=UPI003A928B2D